MSSRFLIAAGFALVVGFVVWQSRSGQWVGQDPQSEVVTSANQRWTAQVTGMT